MSGAKKGGSLYAVVFEQGTVKVGMTRYRPESRIMVHRSWGAKFEIKVYHEMFASFPTDDIEFRESVLCEFCLDAAIQACGDEWFKFKSAEFAVQFLSGAFDRLAVDDFGGCTGRRTKYRPSDYHARGEHAVHLLKMGVAKSEALSRSHVPLSVVSKKTDYREWFKSQVEVNN